MSRWIKELGKALWLDYVQMIAASAARLLDFHIRFGVSTIYFPAKHTASSLPIDIVIPVIDKDSETLPFVIDSARANIGHPIKDIYLVCPGSSVEVRRIGHEKNCKIVDEQDLVPIGPRDITYVWQGHDRSGWMYQQFLKWSGWKFCTQDHYLVIDSDTVFLRPQVFEIGGKLVFDFCDEFHKPYFRAFEKIFRIRPRAPLSFTSHHALIDTTIMAQLIADIEARHRKPWFEAIIATIDPDEMSCISDYDNYAQYVFETLPSKMRVRYWFNKSLSRKLIGDFDRLTKKYGRRYSTLSFHSYK